MANALRTRLDDLEQQPSRWHPEILALLLQLSDQPTFKSRISDLDRLRQPVEDVGQGLTWEAIAEEDNWDLDPAVWKTIRYSASSEDELEDEDRSVLGSASSISENQDLAPAAQDFIIQPPDSNLWDSIRAEQEWRLATPYDSRKVAVPEIHIIREVLFMLQGLPTTIFGADGVPRPDFQTSSLAWQTHRAVLGTFAEYGRQVTLVREFSVQAIKAPHLQVFQDCVARHLKYLDDTIAETQQWLAAATISATVSLIAIQHRLRSEIEPLSALSSILSRLQDAPNAGTFQYLETLYQEVCVSQLSGKQTIYRFLARTFLECFRVYLRPIRHWMDEGRLLPGDEIFFVTELNRETPLGQTWQSRFLLRHSANGSLHAPEFLRPAAGKIFNAGKNIVVLKLLGKSSAITIHQEPTLDFDTVCPKHLELAPFAELFGTAFEDWIQSKYGTTSTVLKNTLFDECGLARTLTDLRCIHLGSNGAALTQFHDAIFDRLDNGLSDWNNNYALTAAGHSAFAQYLDTDRLMVGAQQLSHGITPQSVAESVRVALPAIKATYRLTWSAQIVMTEHSLSQYHAVSTLLMQLNRATSVLRRPKLTDAGTVSSSLSQQALYYALRNNMMWFCSTLQTYITTLVLQPACQKLDHNLQRAETVDSMIHLHEAFAKQIVDESCLSSRLQPIREGLLDIFDLALMLERARKLNGTSNEGRLKSAMDDEIIDADPQAAKPGFKYMAALHQISTDFTRHVRFVCEGLRSVARASSDSRSVKWNMLAEMLQSGSQGTI